jgi:hypothetical protein
MNVQVFKICSRIGPNETYSQAASLQLKQQKININNRNETRTPHHSCDSYGREKIKQNGYFKKKNIF